MVRDIEIIEGKGQSMWIGLRIKVRLKRAMKCRPKGRRNV
jgi:hypothetical protein